MNGVLFIASLVMAGYMTAEEGDAVFAAMAHVIPANVPSEVMAQVDRALAGVRANAG